MRTARADPVTPAKRAARVAGLIEAEIIRQNWPIGASLGSEPALQQRYGVSRAVLREAVRLVEHHQVALMRPGPGGGLCVTVPDAGPATRAMVIYLEYLGITIDELLDARLLIEPLASGLAAERIEEAGIAELRGTLRSSGPPAAHDDFHVVLAEMTGNAVLALFVDVLSRLTARYARDSTVPSADAVHRLAADHASIVDAVTAGNPARATTLTEEHVQIVAGWLRRHHRRGVRGAADAAPTAGGTGKRAEQLAAVIHEDIASRGWPVGMVFGAEGELLERYGVSRSVLREAVRLLEHHAVARMRRGPGGGLVVTEPRPGAAVDAIALYLDYRRPGRDDLRLVREVIEVDNVATVVARRGDPDVAAFLSAQEAVPGTAAPQTDPVGAGMAELFFHTKLAELAGNRVLNLFLSILVELFRRHWTSAQRALPDAADAAAMHHAHHRIVAAIRDGDDAMARHRSRRHLDALASWWV